MENNSKKEMPIGFIMSLMQSEKALNAYSYLENSEKESIIDYITNPLNGDDVKQKIDKVIYELENKLM